MNERTVTADELMGHVAWLRRLARSLLHDRDEAADAAQDTLVAALQSPPDARGNPQAWFGRVLVNRIRSNLRAQRRREARHAVVEKREAVRTPEEMAVSLELQRQIVTLLMELGEPYRQVVFLRYFDDLEPAEIARRLE